MTEYALDNVGLRKLVFHDQPGPQRLYTSNEIAKVVGMSRYWVLDHCMRAGAPPPEYTIVRGDQTQPLWSRASLDRWRAYHAGDASKPDHKNYSGYSDHNAVNRVGPTTVTWKLSWRNTYDGGAMWWFSTPKGWYVSNDDGATWDFADVMVRPTDYRYFSVTANAVSKGSAVAMVLRSATKLRRTIEGKPA